METVNEFKKQQEKAVEVLKQLLTFLQNGERYGVKIDKKDIEKLETGIKSTSEDRLKVVLIGGFSEGKTSIVAAWSEKYTEEMKISQEESTDEVSVYSMGDFDLIDTPGLFGFKENADKEKFKEITRKKISEAHLVLYVMDSVNPIKESHIKEVLLWLFKEDELNLLPRTVFVLSKFDNEADVQNEDDYKKRFEIKRQNVIERLRDFGLNLTNDISIVAVSANPLDAGFEYWLSNMDEFKKLSHIGLLQQATTEKINTIGYKNLIEESKKSIIRDVLIKELPLAEELYEEASKEFRRLNQLCNEVKEELDETKSRLIEKRRDLRNFITELFDDLILEAKGLHFEDEEAIRRFFVIDVGENGINIETKIRNEFENQLNSSYKEISRVEISLNASVKQYNVVSDILKKGLKSGGEYLAGGGITFTNKDILSARDFVKPSHRFHSYEAIKTADKFSMGFKVGGYVLEGASEVLDTIEKAKRQKEFKKMIDDLVSYFNVQKKELLESINDEKKFSQEYFPSVADLENQWKELHTELQAKQQLYENFKKWLEQGKAIDAEFTVME